MKKIQYHTTIY